MIGQTIGHYRIESKLGEGGMGIVYRALDTHLDRPVAIKVLPPEAVANPERRKRFVQEAKAASALNHPNIITIYDIDQDNGVNFIAMEFVPGKTLDRLVGRKGLSLGETLKYSVQIADALAKAHAAGIVHRDLKPPNIMVTDDGHVKVLDFGLAKLTDRTESDEFGPTETMKDAPVETEEGSILGTVAYMSPEQAEGRKLDGRSDIFSFGSVLYEMVTGRRPFQGETKLATLTEILREEPKPAGEVVPGLPHDFGKILHRCLRKEPARRFQTMADLKVALEELKEESDSGRLMTTPAGVAPSGGIRARTVAATLLAVLGVAALAVWFARRTTQEAPPALTAVPLTSYPGRELYPSFSPDGNQVAFSWNGENQDNFDIYVKLIGPGTPLRLTSDPAVDTSPAWSPDGRFIAFLRVLPAGKAGVFLIPALGGPERKLVETYSPVFPYLPAVFLAWSPDSRWLVVPDKSAPNEPVCLALVSIESGEKQRLTFPKGQERDIGPALSPDGRALAFLRAPSSDVNDLYLVALSDGLQPQGEARRLTFDNRWIASPAWTPDGREILFSSDRLAAGRRGLWRIRMSGPKDGPVKPEPLSSLGQVISSLAISRHGPAGSHAARLAYSQGSGDLNIWRAAVPAHFEGEPAGSDLPALKRTPFISSTRSEFGPQYSPDGKRIAFVSDRSGSFEIWLCDADGSNAAQVTSFGGADISLARWSPNGEYLALEAYLEGQADIYAISANGGGLRRLTHDPAQDARPSWSRDGRWIYFGSNRSGQQQLWRMPANGGAAVQITKKGGSAGLESPDGKLLYYAKGPPPLSLWKVPVDGGEETQVLEPLYDWSTFAVVDGGIYFIPRSDPAGGASIQFFSFATGKIQQVTATEKPVGNGLTVSPDGRWILYAQIDQQGSDLMLVENFR